MSDVKLSLKDYLSTEYITKLSKLIPSEVVVLYFAMVGLVPKELVAQLVAACVGLVLVPVYLIFAHKVKNVGQVVVSSLSFLLWVLVGGGELNSMLTIEPWMTGLALMVFSAVAPIFFKAKPEVESVVSTASRVKPWREV